MTVKRYNSHRDPISMKFNRLILIALLAVSLSFTGIVYGAVIEDVVVCHDFDNSGTPIPQDQFPVSTDAVLVWVNMTNVHVNDTLTFEWWPPSGELYHKETWTASQGVESTPSYNMFTEIEIQGEPAENMPGEWSVNIYNNGTWWGHAVFELVTESTPSSPNTNNLSTNALGITKIKTPDSFNVGDNVSVKVTVGYSFNKATDIAPSIWDNNSQSFVGGVNDNVNGQGTKTYDIVFVADDPGTVYYVVAYYTKNENVVYDNQTGLVPFRLEDKSTDVGVSIPSIEDLGLPKNINVDEIKNQISNYVDKLKNLNVTIPDDLSGIKKEVEQRTGIPGYPIGALLLGAATLVWLKRRRY
jgi:hypothetical protein